MAFKRPSLKELIDQTKNDFTNQLNGFADGLRFSLAKVFAYVIAGCTHLLFGFLDYIAKQSNPLTCDIDSLRLWGLIRRVFEKDASFAECDVLLTGTNGKSITEGTLLINPITKVEYRVFSEVAINLGVAVVHLEAQTEGKIGTLVEGDTLTLLSPIAGIQNQAVVQSTNLISGQDKEDIEAYRERVVSHFQQPAQGGSDQDYVNWAKEVAGVTRAWVYPNHLGLSTVGVSFVLDNELDIIPNEAKVLEVQTYIDNLRPVTADVTIFAPIAEILNLTIEIKPNTETIRNIVTAELQDLFKRRAIPSGKIYLSEISESISVAAGEEAHHLLSPLVDFQAGAGKIPKLGVITWQTMS
jgi:uncharacterized phage protein gp47/JayE